MLSGSAATKCEASGQAFKHLWIFFGVWPTKTIRD
jgi:hypothetical protein